MQENTQPIEVRNLNADGSLEVHSIFYTIQGEGPYAGRPAVFIRLAGCNLQCPGCDTDYTSERKLLTVNEIANIVNQKIPSGVKNPPIVVITGGEPFRQNLEPLVSFLRNFYLIQIETNGTLEIPLKVSRMVTVVCSPKTTLIHRNNLNRIDSFKYVLNAKSVCPEDGLPLLALNHSNSGKVYRANSTKKTIYVQPMDCKDPDQNLRNQQAAVESCLKFGYTLQLQIHKIIGVE